MADAVIELEARLKNYISGELANVNASLKGTSAATQETAKHTKQLSDYWKNSTDVTRTLGMSMTKLVSSFVGANAIFSTVRGALGAVNKLLKESVAEYAKFAPSDESVIKLREIEDRWRNIKVHLGEHIVPVTAKWREELVSLMEVMTGAQNTGVMDVAAALKTVSYGNVNTVEALRAKLDELWTQMEGHYEEIGDASGELQKIWVEGPRAGTEEYQKFLKRIEEVDAALQKAQHRVGGAAPKTPTAGNQTAAAAAREKAAREQEELERKAEEARRRREAADKQLIEQAQENLDAKNAIVERDADAIGAAIDRKIEAEEEYNEALERLAHERQALADLDVEIAEAKAQSIVNTTSSMFASIDTMAGAFIENERDRAYTHAVLGSAQALCNMITLATEDSGSWWEALAKGIASAAEIIALWAPIFSDISSAATGGQFVTNGPGLLKVGDNPTGRELVSVTPIGSTNVYGPQTQYDQRRTEEHYHFYSVSDDRIIQGLRSLKRKGQLAEVLRN